MDRNGVVIVGAGPAGLSAAYELVSEGIHPTLFEKSKDAGGIARTEVYKGYRFDMGGHRFFTKIKYIDELWHEILGEEFLKVRRISRIYYRGRFFKYPLSISNTVINLGVMESMRILLSYLNARLHPSPQEDTFEQWVSNRFGHRLYHTFFKTYTEKVWGIPCREITSDWAAQRIKGLSLKAAVVNALMRNQKAKTLIEEFFYPSQGPGLMWDQFVQAIDERGGELLFQAEVTRIRHSGDRRVRSVIYRNQGREIERPLDSLISSMPLPRLISILEPAPPREVMAAARQLSFRSFILVGLIVEQCHLFPDQWIYIHNPAVSVGRIQNFKNWSAAMVPEEGKTSVGMEYFCTEGDRLWTLPDSDLVALAARELSVLGLASQQDVTDAVVFRQPKAYPVYDQGYDLNLGIIKQYLASFDNLQTVGRNGMHRYNNMDHSMATGRLAARNIMGENHQLWEINEEGAYLEQREGESAGSLMLERILSGTFAKIDKIAFATAAGSVLGLLMFVATLWLVIKGGTVIGPNLRLLAAYFKGYTVSVRGAFLAFGYSFLWGFLFGWLFAYIRNFILAFYIYHLKKKLEAITLRDFFNQF
jgi:protoporphyrinogen oxidase